MSNKIIRETNLKKKADRLPDKPGIYFFKNAHGEVIYIGKARSLQERIRNYFLPTSDPKVEHLIKEASDVDYILTTSEKEAFFLESNFVRQHQPKFNLRLKDDKSFPRLRVTVNEEFPGIYFSRQMEEDGARYFGPFIPAQKARTAIHLITKLFKLRSCENAVFKSRKRPCLDYEMGLCSAPCAGLIDKKSYRESVDHALLLLEGRTKRLRLIIRKKMEQASAKLEFEEAARCRDLLDILDDLSEKPVAISVELKDMEVAGFASQPEAAAFYVFVIRKGKIVDAFDWIYQLKPGQTKENIWSRFLDELNRLSIKMTTLILPVELFSKITKESAIGKLSGTIPFRPAHSVREKELTDLARKNAEELLKKFALDAQPLEELRKELGLASLPRLIIGCDISTTGGQGSTGSIVAFRNGKPDKNLYRIFKIKSVRGPDDTACLKEVINRYFKHLSEHWVDLPDFVLVDGGKGQLSVVSREMNKFGLGHIPVASIAKKEEIIFSTFRPSGISLPPYSPALKLIQRIRDEAHRFAISYHRKLRQKKSFFSDLDGIPGLGPAKKALLRQKFESVEAIRLAGPDIVARIIGQKTAASLFSRLKQKESNEKARSDRRSPAS